jgi:hypothetical protein
MNDFQSEWAILHGDIEKYERFSLIIKLFSILTCILSIALAINPIISIFTILILWLQSGIWTTFQNRLEARILIIENNLAGKACENNPDFQLYSEWQKNRPGAVNLIKEYIFNSLKPTVAYPYILLVFLLLIKPYLL